MSHLLLQVHSILQEHIRDWSYENWTSKLRVDADQNYPPFTQNEGGFTDFTYVDHSWQMKTFLEGSAFGVDTAWSNTTTYHLEVKTTTGGCGEPFFVSQNQLDMVCVPKVLTWRACSLLMLC